MTYFLKNVMKPTGRISTASATARFPPISPGARIVNSRGVPGTLGCIAYTLHDQQTVLLSTWHVLFANEQPLDKSVWLFNEELPAAKPIEIGKSLYGKLGAVDYQGVEYHVDCAVASCGALSPPGQFHEPVLNGPGNPQPGMIVTKTGAATGATRGVITNTTYSASVSLHGVRHEVRRQLLVQSLEHQKPFSAEGDSGALVVDESDKALGLLWGSTGRGEGIACPIAPVLYALNLKL